MEHLLLTMFNVRRSTWGFRGLDPDWLDHRMPFFETFCAPSVGAQTNKDSRWLIYVDPATPLDRIGSAVPVGVDIELAPVDADQGINDAVAQRWRGEVLTSKVDNDDCPSRVSRPGRQVCRRFPGIQRPPDIRADSQLDSTATWSVTRRQRRRRVLGRERWTNRVQRDVQR